MRYLSSRVVISLAVFAVVLLLGSQGASAVTMLPVINDSVRVDPGEIYSSSFRLLNHEDKEITRYFGTYSFVPDTVNEDGIPILDTSPASIASWIKVESSSVTISPGGEVDVAYNIEVPVDAEPGGHYGVILNSPESPDVLDVNGIGVNAQLGLLLLVEVSGDIRVDADLLEFGILDNQKLFNRLPVDFFFRLQNNGNVHLKPRGWIHVTGWFRQNIDIIANQQAANSLPDSVRRIFNKWQKDEEFRESADGFFGEFIKEINNFAFGHFTADLELYTGRGDNERFDSSVSFWVIPWRVFTVLIVSLLVLYFLIIKPYNKIVAKRYEGKKKKKTVVKPSSVETKDQE